MIQQSQIEGAMAQSRTGVVDIDRDLHLMPQLIQAPTHYRLGISVIFQKQDIHYARSTSRAQALRHLVDSIQSGKLASP